MELSNIKKIIETVSASEVNKYLAAGWVVLATASMTTDSREYSGPVVKYSLAWDKDGEPVEPKLY
jgi:hypothetical protein